MRESTGAHVGSVRLTCGEGNSKSSRPSPVGCSRSRVLNYMMGKEGGSRFDGLGSLVVLRGVCGRGLPVPSAVSKLLIYVSLSIYSTLPQGPPPYRHVSEYNHNFYSLYCIGLVFDSPFAVFLYFEARGRTDSVGGRPKIVRHREGDPSRKAKESLDSWLVSLRKKT